MVTKINQRTLVLKHLQKIGSITTWEAIKEYGVTRLSAVIFDLRETGWNIDDRYLTTLNRWGNVVSYKEYFLKKPHNLTKRK